MSKKFEDKGYPETYLFIEEENFLGVKGKQLNFHNYADYSHGRKKSYSCQMRLDLEQAKELTAFLFRWIDAYDKTPDKYEKQYDQEES